MKFLFLALLFFCGSLFNSAQAAVPNYKIKELPVQQGGRIKPLDTLAKESLRLIYGKTNYKKKDPSTLVLTWLLAPKIWSETPILQIRNKKLKKALGLEDQRDYYSQDELSKNKSIESLFQNLKVKQDKEAKLSGFDQSLVRLQAQLVRLAEFQSGSILAVEPQATGEKWKNVNSFSLSYQESFAKVLKSMTQALAFEGLEEDKVNPAQKDQYKKSLDTFNQASQALIDKAYEDFAGDSKELKKVIGIETFYNSFHPFRYAWIAYLFALLFVALFWISGKVFFRYNFFSFLIIGLIFHTLGFALRVYISGRAPVSNMYETVLWVPFGALVFGILVGFWQKSIFPYVASSLVALLCLIVADFSPVILDPSIQPLQSVLRSNFWLLVHVITITISYSAFFLAFVMSDFSLFYHLNENHFRKEIKDITQSIYRCLQIGVLLLAAGTILGGVWADASWGRFWGWDPKETWAFITLMGYLALLHARLVGMVKSFGMAAGSVLSFSLVLMAWYGVNFWLGVGKHSYGFGAGGVEYVSAFVALHIIFVLFVGFYKKLREQ